MSLNISKQKSYPNFVQLEFNAICIKSAYKMINLANPHKKLEIL